MAIALIESAALPVLERVTICAALVVPVACAAKVRLVVESIATGPVPVPPVPVSITVCVVGLAVSVKVRLALRAPVAAGLNVTLMVQLLPPVRVAGSVPQVLVCAKSVAFVPPSAMLLSVIDVVPEL